MASKLTIAELAERKAELLDELSAVNAEIKSRAGERDDDADEFDAESAEVETATDKSTENVENTSATT
ncbi:hypothetical protein [Mycolicibacterium phlei]